MNVYLNEITGIADGISTLFFSKKSWTRELELDIRNTCFAVLDRCGRLLPRSDVSNEMMDKYERWMATMTKWGVSHITMLRFIDFSFTVEGLHRAGQDDWDSHAQRFNNRIIRTSTRETNGFEHEMSSYYEGKIIPLALILDHLGIELPSVCEIDGNEWVKAPNGYIIRGEENNPDVRRGLYMESIPSNFIFKVNLTEFSHVFKERNKVSRAHPEVKEACEMMADQIQKFQPAFTRDLLNNIKN